MYNILKKSKKYFLRNVLRIKSLLILNIPIKVDKQASPFFFTHDMPPVIILEL